jgi:valyl-tRNA synthetase
MLSKWPELKPYNEPLINRFEEAKTAIAEIRTVRKDRNISYKEQIALLVKPGTDGYSQEFNAVVAKMGGLTDISLVTDKPANAAGFMVKTSEFFVPLAETLDVEEEMKKLQEEIAYQKGFLKAVMGKLNNQKFVAGAPEQVVSIERKKQADAEAKIKAIEEQMALLKK